MLSSFTFLGDGEHTFLNPHENGQGWWGGGGWGLGGQRDYEMMYIFADSVKQ